MFRKTVKSPSLPKASDIALGGSITGLHIVVNPQTKEKLIVGGADDGSVAFWRME
jgi:hypothetical protein